MDPKDTRQAACNVVKAINGRVMNTRFPRKPILENDTTASGCRAVRNRTLRITLSPESAPKAPKRSMNRYTVIRKGVAVSFDSPYTTVAAIERCRALVDGGNTFAGSLVKQWDDRGLSDNQIGWVHKLATDADTAATAVQVGAEMTAAAPLNLSPVVELFATAADHLNYPRMTFDIPERGAFIVLSLCGEKSKTPGAVNVTNGESYGSPGNRYFGRVNRDGSFTPGRDITPLIRKVVEEVAKDAAGFAARYGRKSGRCCFCHAELTDDRSTLAGYGRTCAAHWSMPWGERPAPVAEVTPQPEPAATAPATVAAPAARRVAVRRPRRKSLPDPVATMPAEVVNVKTPAALAMFDRLAGVK